MNILSATRDILKSTKDTLESSSIHAIPNIVRNKFYLIKIMWLLCFLTSTGACGWFMYKSISEYLKYDVVSNVKIEYVNRLEFPVVSVCNFNRWEDVILNETIISCEFNSKECSIDGDFETYLDKNYVYCFRFNSRNVNGSKIKYSYSKGDWNALDLEVYLGSNIIESDKVENGLVLFINDENLDSSYQSAIKLSPGFSYDIVLSKYKVIKQPKPYSNCVGDLINVNSYDSVTYKKTFLYNKNYKFSYCSDMCMQKLIGDNCSIQATFIGGFYYENKKNVTEDNVKEDESACIVDAIIEFKNTPEYLEECDCPLECEFSGYNYYKSMNEYPTKDYAKGLISSSSYLKNEFPNYNDNDFELFRSNILKFQIYFDEMKETIISHEIKTQLPDLVASVGGTLGLFLGLSFLSMVEFIEILMQTLIILFKYI